MLVRLRPNAARSRSVVRFYCSFRNTGDLRLTISRGTHDLLGGGDSAFAIGVNLAVSLLHPTLKRLAGLPGIRVSKIEAYPRIQIL